MPYFAFVDTNAVLVKKNDKTYMNIKKAPLCKGRLGVDPTFLNKLEFDNVIAF